MPLTIVVSNVIHSSWECKGRRYLISQPRTRLLLFFSLPSLVVWTFIGTNQLTTLIVCQTQSSQPLFPSRTSWHDNIHFAHFAFTSSQPFHYSLAFCLVASAPLYQPAAQVQIIYGTCPLMKQSRPAVSGRDKKFFCWRQHRTAAGWGMTNWRGARHLALGRDMNNSYWSVLSSVRSSTKVRGVLRRTLSLKCWGCRGTNKNHVGAALLSGGTHGNRIKIASKRRYSPSDRTYLNKA